MCEKTNYLAQRSWLQDVCLQSLLIHCRDCQQVRLGKKSTCNKLRLLGISVHAMKPLSPI